jgi:hypothetical protein
MVVEAASRSGKRRRLLLGFARSLRVLRVHSLVRWLWQAEQDWATNISQRGRIVRPCRPACIPTIVLNSGVQRRYSSGIAFLEGLRYAICIFAAMAAMNAKNRTIACAKRRSFSTAIALALAQCWNCDLLDNWIFELYESYCTINLSNVATPLDTYLCLWYERIHCTRENRCTDGSASSREYIWRWKQYFSDKRCRYWPHICA